MGIDDSLSGNAAPSLASRHATPMCIGDIACNWLELDRKSALHVSRVCLFRQTQAREKKRFSLREEVNGAAFSEMVPHVSRMLCFWNGSREAA
jgi:hypothetical protein